MMREEERERIYVHSEFFAKWVLDQQGIDPELVIELGEPVPEILAQERNDPEIGVLLLDAGAGNLQNFLFSANMNHHYTGICPKKTLKPLLEHG